MPRAFLITNKRYNSAVDYEEGNLSRETSPERTVSTAEEPPCDSKSSSCGSKIQCFKPTSPRSPAHEFRGPSCADHEDESQERSRITSTKVCCNLNSRLDEVSSSASLVLTLPATTTATSTGVLRMATSNTTPAGVIHTSPGTATALVTVIRHLIQQQQHQEPPSSSIPQALSKSATNTIFLNDLHVCPECGKRYSTSSNLARHRQTHRSVTDKKARKCPHCDKVYVSMPAYSMHVRTHSQGCQCPYCGKSFSRPWLLQGHIRTHTGEKPFSCPVCHKAFADKSNLRAHIQTHSNSKPYVCQRCNKAFALKSYLYKHEESSCMRLHRQQDRSKDVKLDVQEAPSVLVV